MSWEDILKLRYNPPKKFGYESDEDYKRRLAAYDRKHKSDKRRGVLGTRKEIEEDEQRKKDKFAQNWKELQDSTIDYNKFPQVLAYLQKEVERRFKPSGNDPGEEMLQRIFMNQAWKPMKELIDIYLAEPRGSKGGIKEWNRARRYFAQIILDPRYVGLLNNLRLARDDESLERFLEDNGFGDGSE